MKNLFFSFVFIAMAAIFAPPPALAHHAPGHKDAPADKAGEKGAKSAQTASPAGMEDPVVVLELFTTGGCSKCPPADALLKLLRDEVTDNDIVFGCHVTYFDQSVRKDPISLPACDERHKTYQERQAIQSFFVPQLVVNGRYPSKGNEEKLVRAAYNLGRSEGGVLPAALRKTAQALEVDLPALPPESRNAPDFKALLWLLANEEDRIFTITGNPGEEPIDVEYVNGVRGIMDLGAWDGGARSLSLPLRDLPEAYGYVVLAQDAANMQMLAAGKAEGRGISLPPEAMKDPAARQSLPRAGQEPGQELKTP